MGMLPPLSQIPRDVVALADYVSLARERMTEPAWAYLSGGAADESTLRDNSEAFARLRLNGRVLAKLANGHTRINLFGDVLEHPIVLAPVAYQKLAHVDGERASVLGAAAVGAAFVVSTEASMTIEELAPLAQTPLWFQVYIQADRGFTRELVQRAEAAGCRALMLTVDAPISGVRNREQRAGFALPAGVEAVNLRGMQRAPQTVARAGTGAILGSALLDHAATWDDLSWLQAQTRLPMLVKGVTSAVDAARALDHGVAGIVVSNHGGRTLDTLPASIDALPPIADVIAGRVPILVDGGIRRGTDVLKALALGASAVMIGRPYVHALAAAGAAGVAHVVHLLRTELEAAMVLTGCATLAAIDRTVIWRGQG